MEKNYYTSNSRVSNHMLNSTKNMEKISLFSENEDKEKSIIIFQLNVSGINDEKKFYKIKEEIFRLGVKVDIILFTETKLNVQFNDNIYKAEGYIKYTCCRDPSRSVCGVLAFINKKIKIVSNSQHTSTFDMLKINFISPFNESDIISLICYYRQPKVSIEEPFFDHIVKELEESTFTHTIIAGDVNFDALKKNQSSKTYVDLLNRYNFTITNNMPTRKSKSGRVVDHFAINFEGKCSIKNFTIENELSDHHIILSILSKNETPSELNNTDTNIIEVSNINQNYKDAMNAIKKNLSDLYSCQSDQTSYLDKLVPGTEITLYDFYIWIEGSEKVEKVICERLHKKICDKMPKNQFGLRKNCNEEIALNDLINVIKNKKDKNYKVSLTSFNIKYDLEFVNDDKLLHMLNIDGITDEMKKLLIYYFKNVKRIINDNENFITENILSKYLFTMYINELSKTALKGTLYMYETNCILLNYYLKKANDRQRIKSQVEEDMEMIMKTMKDLGLKLEPEMIKCLIFGPKSDKINLNSINLESGNELKILKVDELSYLGLTIDRNLNWKNHINNIKEKVQKACEVLWGERKNWSLMKKRNFYSAEIETTLKSLISIWGMAAYSAIDQLQILQNTALKSVFNLHEMLDYNNQSVIYMYANNVMNHLPIEGLFYEKINEIVYGIVNGIYYVNNMKIKKSDDGNLLVRMNKKSNAGSLDGRGFFYFNELPRKIRSAENIDMFISMLKSHINEENNKEFISIFLKNFRFQIWKKNKKKTINFSEQEGKSEE